MPSSGFGYADNARLKGVAYLSAMYMAVLIEEVKAFEQSRFCKIHESKIFQTSTLFG